jgi:hypothetical protein
MTPSLPNCHPEAGEARRRISRCAVCVLRPVRLRLSGFGSLREYEEIGDAVDSHAFRASPAQTRVSVPHRSCPFVCCWRGRDSVAQTLLSVLGQDAASDLAIPPRRSTPASAETVAGSRAASESVRNVRNGNDLSSRAARAGSREATERRRTAKELKIRGSGWNCACDPSSSSGALALRLGAFGSLRMTRIEVNA